MQEFGEEFDETHCSADIQRKALRLGTLKKEKTRDTSRIQARKRVLSQRFPGPDEEALKKQVLPAKPHA